MAEKIQFLRSSAVEQLRHSVPSNVGLYYSDYDFTDFFDGVPFSRQTSIEYDTSCIDQIKMPEQADNYDAENSVVIYQGFSSLTPEQAADERIWAYLCHFEFFSYAKARWLDPNEHLSNIVSTHFFARGNRAFMRDNAISRLWWMGYVASKLSEVTEYDVGLILKVLMFRSDVRANLLERPSTATNLNVFAAILRLLVESYDSSRSLFERAAFRKFMRRVNVLGGLQIMDVLSIDEIYKELQNELDGQIEMKLG